MSTKSNRSAGTQHTQKGVVQGHSLVDPKTGNPVAVVLGDDGKYRLAVDANVTANFGDLLVSLEGTGPDGDNLYIVDNVTGNKLKINSDGTIDANVIIDALSGDNIMVVGTEDATVNGTKHTLKIGSDGNARVVDEEANSKLQDISNTLQTATSKLDHVGTGSSLNAVLFEGDLSDYRSISFDLVASTSPAFIGTISVFARNNAVAPWKAVYVQSENNSNAVAQSTIDESEFINNFSAGRTFKYYKLEITSYTSGTAILYLHASQSEVELQRTQTVEVQGNAHTIGGAISLGLYSGASKNAIITPTFSFQNYSQIAMQIYGGFQATIVFEASENNSIWKQVSVINADTNERIWEATYNGLFIYTGELTYFRARIHLYTSGTVYCRTLSNQNNYARNTSNPIDHVFANLKTLEMLGKNLNDFVITNEDEIVYNSDGSLVRFP